MNDFNMKILILGGTGFVGRILTENLIQSGFEPVLFNRGKRNPDIFPSLRKITGDRLSEDIEKISVQNWDVVVDFSGQFPDNVEHIIEMLKRKIGRYIFVSSASAYNMEDEDNLREPITEDFETFGCTAEQRRDKDILATYSQKKAECERVLLNADWLDVIIFRPALIYGRYDPSDRFYYWLYKAKNQNKILIPADSTRVTNTYSEDFARIIEKALTIDTHGRIYNAVTHDPVSLKEIVATAADELGTSPELVYCTKDFLEKNELQPWSDIPLWLGGANLILDNERLKRDFGIRFESFKASVTRCIDYYSALGWKIPIYGLSPDKENTLLKLLKTSKNN